MSDFEIDTKTQEDPFATSMEVIYQWNYEPEVEELRRLYVKGAGRLDQHGVPVIEQELDQSERTGVRQGLPPCDFDQRRRVGPHLRQDLVEAHAFSTLERVLGVTPYAPKRTPREAHEGARQPRPGRFALHRVEDLRNA